MKDVAGHKARLASGITGRRLGLGSEGSFGPHPYIPFAAVDQEMVALYDRELGITIYESVVSLRTNFLHLDIDKSSDLDAFLRCIGFPQHGIVIGIADEPAPWTKGVQKRHELDSAISELAKRADGRAIRITTDMRAHVNPTRMRVIRAAAARLARRVKSLCPSCGAPGFGIVDVQRGAPCSDCGEPTERIAATLLGCACCPRRELQPVRKSEPVDPKYCLVCNP
ncbi:MAG: hypothetical protein JSR78_03125 [Proteobacteria bacterium]|nr:hypothetical protein [Pseudomonadota bacterium]